MKTRHDSGAPYEVEDLLMEMKKRIHVADMLADLCLGKEMSPREEALAHAIMHLCDDWEQFEASILAAVGNEEPSASLAERVC